MIERDLGNLKFGVAHKFEVEFENKENVPVIIRRVTPDCKACTSITFDKKLLLPGDKAILEITFTPGSTGANIKGANIFYDFNNISKSEKIKFRAWVK